jgi:protein involved in sex pheromone biosynthesis
MAKQLILEVIKAILVLSGCKGIGGDKAGKGWIQPINNKRN